LNKNPATDKNENYLPTTILTKDFSANQFEMYFENFEFFSFGVFGFEQKLQIFKIHFF
jgi:hypothetical protein